MQTKTTIRFFTIADYEKEQEYIFALLFGILICLYLLVCKNICKLLNNRMHAPRTFYCHEPRLRRSPLLRSSFLLIKWRSLRTLLSSDFRASTESEPRRMRVNCDIKKETSRPH